jgi:glutamyl-tRNA reductase
VTALLLVGLNHRTAPVEVRERLSIPDARLPEILAELNGLVRIEGTAIVSTCNRVEAVISSSDEDVIAPVVEWLARRSGTSRGTIEKHLYVLRHADVVKHLFRVASGLDSMILGEPQIAGQVRFAFQTARDLGTLDPLLLQLFEQTMRVGKRIRTETGIGEHAVSVPYAALELARKIFGDLSGLQVLLVGAGEMGELTAEHFAQQHVRQVIVANRSHERAEELAERFHGQAVRFDALQEQLADCDVVVVSTGAPHFLITAVDVASALETRRGRNLFLIDLSVPRNIDPEIAALEGAYLYNIDDLQNVADSNLDLRQKKAVTAEAIVAKEVDLFRKRVVAQDAVPTILELQERLEAIRMAELEKCLRKMGPVTAEQRAALEQFSTQMVNKILHYPILNLKEASEEPQERESLRRTIRKIFGL